MIRLLGLQPAFCVGAVALSPLAYFTWGWTRGATPGMTALRLRVERPTGKPPGAGRAFARALIVYPFGFSASALAIAILGHLMGAYPSGALPATALLRFLVLSAVTSVYAGTVLLSRREHQGRAAHDLISGLVVLGPQDLVAKIPSRPPSAPLRRMSRWFLVATPVLVLVGGVFAWGSLSDLWRGDAGPALVGMVLAGASTYGCWEILRRAIAWQQTRLGVPLPRYIIQRPAPISRWFLVALPPTVVCLAIFVTASISLIIEPDPAGASLAIAVTLSILYGLWELARRAGPLPGWAGGARNS